MITPDFDQELQGLPMTTQYARTPLHVDFGEGPDFMPSREDLGPEEMQDGEVFNAIGSHCVRIQGMHLPVVDVDGGARLKQFGSTSKVVLGAAYAGVYDSHSDLRDVLGLHGIDLEVWNRPGSRQVSAIALRSTTVLFAVRPSSTEGHHHLFINGEPFGDEEHRLLLEGLKAVGVTNHDWNMLTRREGMGIVRAPWSKKAPGHIGT